MAATYSVSPSALQRHKSQHIPETLARASAARDTTRSNSLLDHVRQLQARSSAILERAESAGDLRTALAALRELRGILQLLAQHALKSGATVELAVVEAYVQKIFDLLYEFVPENRIAAAIAKLTDLIEFEADLSAVQNARSARQNDAVESRSRVAAHPALD
ncbi:MAG: hypothetical protein ABIR79_09555 [Candidatus Binatia bacterium]